MQDNEPTLAAVRKLGTWRFNFFLVLCLPRGQVHFAHKRRLLKTTTLMGTQTCTRQLVLDQHNKSQSRHGLLKLHLVSKLNLRKRKTKSLSGWKLKCRSSKKFTIRWETRTEALQVIKHIVCFTTFLRRKIQDSKQNCYCCLASFRTFKILLVNGLNTSVIVPLIK